MKLRLLEKKDEAEATKSFFFDNPGIKFQPGQYIYITLPKLAYPDEKGFTRHFTFSSSPTEVNSIRLTTRIRQESGYKRTLDELPIGSEVEAEGPNGTFIFDDSEKNAQIFVAGGIGITPFRSIIKYAIDKNISIPMYLIYSNSTEQQITFKSEIDEWVSKYNFLKVHYEITSVSGHLDQAKITSLCEGWQIGPRNTSWWVCGPPQMVTGIEEVLNKMNIPQNLLHTERFTGY